MTGWPSWFEQVLRTNLPAAPADQPLDPDLSLTAYGLDSFGWLVLVDELRPWVDLPDRLLLPSTFRTIGSLWSAVADVLGRTESLDDAVR